MGSITRLPLSGKTASLPILVSDTTTPGVAIHTAVDTASILDELWLWATNNTGADMVLSLEFYDGSNTVEKTLGLPANGEYLVCPGISYGDGLVIRVYASADVLIDGYVNRTDFT